MSSITADNGADDYVAFYPRPGKDFDERWFETELEDNGLRPCFEADPKTPEGRKALATYFGFATKWAKEEKRLQGKNSCEIQKAFVTMKAREWKGAKPGGGMFEGMQRQSALTQYTTSCKINPNTGELGNELTFQDMADQLSLNEPPDPPPTGLSEIISEAWRSNSSDNLMNELLPVKVTYIKDKNADVEEVKKHLSIVSYSIANSKRNSAQRGPFSRLADTICSTTGSLVDENKESLCYNPDPRDMPNVPRFTGQDWNKKRNEWEKQLKNDEDVTYDSHMYCEIFNTEACNRFVREPLNAENLPLFLQDNLSFGVGDPTIDIFTAKDPPDHLKISPPFVPTWYSEAIAPGDLKKWTLTSANCNETILIPIILTVLYAASQNKTVHEVIDDEWRIKHIDYMLKSHVNSERSIAALDLRPPSWCFYGLGTVPAQRSLAMQPLLGTVHLLTNMLNAVVAHHCDDDEQKKQERRDAFKDGALAAFRQFLEKLDVGKGGETYQDQLVILGEYIGPLRRHMPVCT
jgi:hypothetical protein